jgi:hypothetical protein
LGEGHRIATDAAKPALALRSLHVDDDSHALTSPFFISMAFFKSE